MTTQEDPRENTVAMTSTNTSTGASAARPLRDTALDKARASAQPDKKPGRPWAGPLIAVAVLAAMIPFAYTLRLGIVTTLTTALLYAVVALGWNLLGGYGGYMNFGVAVFTGSGAYAAAVLNSDYGWPMWPSLAVALVVAVLVALPIGLATLRLRGYFFAIFTLALISLAQVIVLNSGTLGGALGVYTTAPASTPRALAALFYLTLLGLTVVAVVLSFAVEHSRFGYALRAIREDEDAAAVLGVRTSEVKLRALLLGAALAGAAGGVYAFRTAYIEPTGTFNMSFSLDIVLVCVIGGMGTWHGPLIGSFIVVLLEQWLRTAVPDFHPLGATIPVEVSRVFLGLLLIFFAMYARRGIAGMFSRARGRRLAV
jgi:branched-chain amino acid transport system permease protein